MANEPREVAIPVEQVIVRFYDRDILAVRLPDGRIAAVLSTLCDALQLNRPGQLQRIRNDDLLTDQLVLAQVQTAGGPQPMDVLTAWAIPTWLTGIKLSRVAPEKRPAIQIFKREAADVLYRHFSQRQAQLTAPSTLVPAEPISKPETPERGAPLSDWRIYHEAMVAWIDWQTDVEQWRSSIESRLESVEEVSRLVP